MMKKFLSEFKQFALKGNMLDLAIGVIIGASFNAVVTSIVNDILMPIIGILTGGHDFSGLTFGLGDAQIKYGLFIQNAINLLIVAFCLFMIVKAVNLLNRKKEEEKEEVVEEKEEEKPADIVLLEEIRDALAVIKENNAK